MTILAFHPLSAAMPMISGRDFDDLVASIRAEGLREPLILHEGQILDGRARFQACAALGIVPITGALRAGVDPLRFLVERNIRRRDLTPGQRALLVAPLVTASHGGNMRARANVTTTADAAALGRVSERLVGFARGVLAKALPEEIAAVREGRASVDTIGRALSAGLAPAQRRRKIGEPNAARQATRQLHADIWAHLRTALTELAALPLPREVARIVRAQDKGGLVERRLDKSIKWLEDFDHAWRHRDPDAEKARQDAAE